MSDEIIAYQLVFSDGRTSSVLYSKDEAERFKKASDITVDVRPLYATPPAPSVAVKALQDIVERSNNGELGTSKVIDMRNIALSALSAQVQDVAGWQPIETAPKDGSSVLGFWSYTYLGDKEPTTGIEIIEWHDGKFHGWKDRDGVTQDGVYTHWMLLPEAPAAPAKQEG